jgi:ATP-dependent DNA helicase RecG
MTLTDTQALAVGGQHRWENEPVPDWTVDDLDASEITRTIDEAIRRRRAEDPGTRDPTELLRGLGLTRGDRLLRAAVVLFGRSDQRNCYADLA